MKSKRSKSNFLDSKGDFMKVIIRYIQRLLNKTLKYAEL